MIDSKEYKKYITSKKRKRNKLTGNEERKINDPIITLRIYLVRLRAFLKVN